MKKVITLLYAILLFASPVILNAQKNYTGASGGSWNVAGNWSGGTVPVSTDNVVIPAATTVFYNAGTLTIASITVQGTLTNNTSSSNLTITTNFTVEATGTVNVSGGSGTLTVGGILSNSGSMSVTSGSGWSVTMGNNATSIVNSGTLVFRRLTINSGTLTTSSSFSVLYELSGPITASAGTITIGNNDNNGGTFTTSSTLTFYNLTVIANAGSLTTSSSTSTWRVNNVFTVGSNTSFRHISTLTMNDGSSIVNSGTLTLKYLTINGTVTTASSFIVEGYVNSTGSFTCTGGTVTLKDLSYVYKNNPSNTLTFNNLTVFSGATILSICEFAVAGVFTVSSSATFTPGSSTTRIITFNNGASIVNSGTCTFNTIAIAPSATVTTSSSFGIGAAFTVGSGASFAPSSNSTITLNNGASIVNSGTLTFKNLTIAASATVTTTSNLNISGAFSNGSGATFSPTAGTVTFNGTSQTIANTGTLAFYNLTTTNNTNLTSSASFSLKAALTINSGSSFSASGSSAITLSTTSAAIMNNGTLTFKNITISPSVTVLTSSSFYIDGTLTVGSGATFSPSSGTIRLNTGSSIVNDGTLSFYSLNINNNNGIALTNNLTINGDLTLGNGLLTTGSHSLELLGGIIVGSGSIDAANGTINFTGTNDQSINGNPFAGNVKKISINKASGTVTLSNTTASIGVTNLLSLTAGNLSLGNTNIVLVSSNGSTANLDNTSGFGTLTYGGTGKFVVERYVPAKAARKFSFITAPINGGTLRNAWQQQIFVTGAGTGGAATCAGTTSGDGVATTDKYNSNGFDVSASNAATLYSYDGSLLTGSRWVAVANTSTTLVPGKGYRVNVRGTRGTNDANCNSLLNSVTPNAPDAVVLSAAGTLTNAINMGDVAVTLDGASGDYTLLGNPYPSTIDFDLFNAGNASLGGKYWFYSPESSAGNGTQYSAYTTGSMTNKPTGYTDANSNYIASGQSFFVQKAGASTVTFKETHKANEQSGSFRTQSYNWSNAIRAGLKNADGSVRYDEVLIRFSNNNGIATSYTDAWDARSLNEGSNVLVSFKNNEKLAIQTRPLSFINDTVRLGVNINAIGTYRLAFSEFEQFSSAAIIKLRDKFLNTEQDIRTNTVYGFSVNTDANSKGDNRFEIVFSSNAALPLGYVGITAKNKGTNDAEIAWQLASEMDVNKYEVERSADATNFITRGSIISKGNSSTMQQYIFTDLQRLMGASYYRVKAIDKSGKINYSPIVKLNNGKEQLAFTIYPNPVKDQLNLLLQNETGSYTIKIVTVTGKTLLVQNGSAINGNIIAINTASFQAGVYILEVINNKGEKVQGKIIKQ